MESYRGSTMFLDTIPKLRDHGLPERGSTFFLMFGSLLCSSLSTSGARSRAISAEHIFPRAQRARPTMN